MAAILNEAILPNLVQTTESTPAFVHGGPFANIAHGCNSILATRMALATGRLRRDRGRVRLRPGRREVLRPEVPRRPASTRPPIVIVATIRALKMHGGVALDASKDPNPAAVERGLENLAAHLDSAAHFGKPIVVAINQFGTDTAEELEVVHDYCAGRGVPCATADVFGAGGGGAIELAEKVVAAAAGPETPLQPLYPLDWPAERKIERIARVMYGADGVTILPAAAAKLRKAAQARLRRAARSAWPRRRTRSPTTPSSAAGPAASR